MISLKIADIRFASQYINRPSPLMEQSYGTQKTYLHIMAADRKITPQKAVRALIAGRLLTSFGEGLAGFAVTVIAIQNLGGIDSGVAVAIAFATGALIGNIVGSLADFYAPPRIITLSAFTATATSLTLTISSLTDTLTLPIVVIISFIITTCSSALSRADTTAFVHMLTPEDLPQTFGFIAARTQVAAAIAGIFAGITLNAWQSLPFIISTTSWIILIGFTIVFGRAYIAANCRPQEVPDFGFFTLFAGFAFAIKTRPIAAVIIISATANLFLEGAGTIIEIDLIASGVSVVLVGMLGTFTSLAALVGSLFSGTISARFTPRLLFIMVFMLLSSAMLFCALSQNYWIIVTSLSCAVILIPSLGVSTAVALAQLAPDTMQARVSGASAIVSIITSAISPGLYGFSYARFSRFVTLFATACALGTLAVIARYTIPQKLHQQNP